MSLARIVADNFPITPTKTVLTGNGSTSVFTINGSTGLTNSNELIVTLDGAVQEPTVDYTVNNNTLTFTTAPDSGAKVVVIYNNAPYTINSVVPNDGGVTNAKLGSGSVTPDKLSTNAPTWNASTGVLTLNGGSGTSIGNGVSRGLFDDGSNIALRPPPNGDIYLQNNGGTATNLFVDSSTSQVGIGTTTPSDKLDVRGGSIRIGSNGHGIKLTDASGTNSHLVSQSDNNLVLYGTDSTGASRPIWSVFQRSNSSALEMAVPLNMNGNDIRGSITTCKAWINFNGDVLAQPSTIANATNSISTTSGQSTGIWTVTGGGWVNDVHLGLTYFINVANAYNSLGGIPAVAGKGVQVKIIQIISGTQARVQYTQNATSSVTLVGTATVAGWQFNSDGVRSSYNISAVTNLATGRQRIFFSTPFSDRNSIILTGATKYASDNGSTAVTVGFDRTTNTPQTTYCDVQTNASNTGYNNQIVSLAFFGN